MSGAGAIQTDRIEVPNIGGSAAIQVLANIAAKAGAVPVVHGPPAAEESANMHRHSVNSPVAEPRRVVHIEEIRSTSGQQKKQLNNQALKSIRDTNEVSIGVPFNWRGVELIHKHTFEVMSLEHGKGEAYRLFEPKVPWSWKMMLNGMDDETLGTLAGETGIASITCQPIPNTDDGKRVKASRKQGVEMDVLGRVPIWDFVVTRSDGTRVRFHPKPTNRDISITDWCACSECPDQPRVMPRCLCNFRLCAAVAANLPQGPAALATPNRKSPIARGQSLFQAMKGEWKSPTAKGNPRPDCDCCSKLRCRRIWRWI